MNDILTPSTIHAAAMSVLPAADIDHHATDLYIRVTPASKALINRFQYRHMVQTFVDNIDHVLWYDLPFCYNPTMINKEGAQ